MTAGASVPAVGPADLLTEYGPAGLPPRPHRERCRFGSAHSMVGYDVRDGETEVDQCSACGSMSSNYSEPTEAWADENRRRTDGAA